MQFEPRLSRFRYWVIWWTTCICSWGLFSWGACAPSVSTKEVVEREGAQGDFVRDGAAPVERTPAVRERVAERLPEISPEPSSGGRLPPLHPFDAAKAAAGKSWLTEKVLGKGLVPKVAMENLWAVWGTGPSSGEAYWEAFRKRYGFYEAPFANGGLPMGIRDAGGGMVSFDCLMCHAGRVAGKTIIGAPNSTLDMQGLFDDLTSLAALAAQFGFPKYPAPWKMTERTGAAGATDAFGLGMELSKLYGPSGASINIRYGFQRPTGWWTMRVKRRIYADGSGQVGGIRSMMAMLLAFGMSWSELQALEARAKELQQYMLSLPSPRWTLSPIDPVAKARGEAIFSKNCARCHGEHTGAKASYPDRILPLQEVGTDPQRASSFTEKEAKWINASWFGQGHPMRATGGYIAPPLTGIWARAPYFHNGSVPDLLGVLDPAKRPTRWERTGSEAKDYDPVRVGWRVKVIAKPSDTSTIQGRKVYDTTRPGLSNKGHDFGAALTDAQRSDLLAYLKSL